MAPDGGVEPSGGGKAAEFGGSEGGVDRSGAVGDGEGMPAKERCRGAEEPLGAGVAVKINSDEGAAGDGGKGAEQGDDGIVGEMMEEEGAEDVVDGGGSEGEAEGVGNEHWGRSGGEVARQTIGTKDGGAGEGGADEAGMIAGGGADIEEGEACGGMEVVKQLAGDGMPAEVAVDADNIGKVASGDRRRGGVQAFGGDAAGH